MRVPDFRRNGVRGDFKDTTSIGSVPPSDGVTMTPAVAMNVLAASRLDTFTQTALQSGGSIRRSWRTSLVRRQPRDGTHARVVLARAHLVVPPSVGPRIGGSRDVGGFRMALARHRGPTAPMAIPVSLSPDRGRSGGCSSGNQSADSRSGDLSGRRTPSRCRALYNAFRPHGGRA